MATTKESGSVMSQIRDDKATRQSAQVAVVLGLIVAMKLSVLTPVGTDLFVPVQVTFGSAVVRAGDIYLLFVSVGLCLYYRQLWIPKSRIVLYMSGIVVTMIGLVVVKGGSVQSLVETVQWAEMVVLSLVVGVLLREEWQRDAVLRFFVLIGTISAAWLLLNFAAVGYPGRRYDILFQGAALIILVGRIMVQPGWRPTVPQLMSFLVLSAAMLVGLERKVWLGVIAASCLMTTAHICRHRTRRILYRSTVVTAVVVLGTLAIVLFGPDSISRRLFSLLTIVPGIGGAPQFERVWIFQTGFNMFRDNVVLGVGPGNWHEFKFVYGSEGYLNWQANPGPHSLFLKMLAETGLAGCSFLAALVLLPVRFFGWHVTRHDPKQYLPLLGYYVFIVVVAMFRAGGLIVRSNLFLVFGFLLSYQVYHEYD